MEVKGSLSVFLMLLLSLLLPGCGGGGGGGGSSPESLEDSTAPMVSTTSPINGAVNCPIDSAVSVTFSEAIDASTVTTATFQVEGVSGTVQVTGNTATFTPLLDLTSGTTYTATVTTQVTDLADNALAANFTWDFTTGAAPDTVAPTVSSTSPAADATDVAFDSAVSVTFSEAMDASTVTTATFQIEDVSGTVSLNGSVATFTPAAELDPETTYTATVTTGVTDLAGIPLAANFTWDFTTGAEPDTVAPEVTDTSPAADATDVAFDSAVSVTFSEAMDASTVTTATFQVEGVSGTVQVTGNTVTFTPAAELDPETTYTATVTTGVTDLAGNALAANFTWDFTTGVAPDTVAPTVTDTSPAADATDVAFDSAVSVTFSEAMDTSTVTTATFQVEDVSGTVQVTGDTATFTPLLDLAAGTTYTATVTTGVTDLAGNPLDADHTFSFTTAAVAWSGTVQIGDTGMDDAWSVAVGPSGNIYVAGYTETDLGGSVNQGGTDAFLAKYDASGTEQWIRLIGTTGEEVAAGVAVDQSGNIYVAGDTDGELPGNLGDPAGTHFLTKYNADGDQQWVTQFDSDANGQTLGIAADFSGAIYVCGCTVGDLTGEDAFLVQFDEDGAQNWVVQFGTAGDDNAFAVAMGNAGELYVAGTVSGDLDGAGPDTYEGGYDVYLAEIDPSDGTILMTRQIGTDQRDVSTGLAIDSYGNIYIGGDTEGDLEGASFGDLDAFVAKFDAAGNTLVIRQFGSTEFDDAFGGIAVDESGMIYVTGETKGDLDGNSQLGLGDAYLIQFDADLSTNWTKTLGTADEEYTYGIDVGPGGGIFIVGPTYGDLDGNVNPNHWTSDGFLAKYNADGVLQ